MRFLLDTNAVISLFKAQPIFMTRLRAHDPSDVVLSAIVLHELFFGAFKSHRRDDNLARIEALRLETLDFTIDDARVAGEIRADLAASGRPIGPYDALIAAQAVSRDVTLVTHNTREFSRVSGLLLVDWEVQ